MKIKRKYIIISVVLFLVITATAISVSTSSEKKEIYHEVKKGKFEAIIECKGEINGLKALEIRLPEVFSNTELRIYQMKITDLIQDGKTVKKGDFIAQLDASQIMPYLQTEQQNLERAMSDLNNAKIDSAIQLSQKREEIKNALLDLEYNKIDLEQSVFESEAYQRKAQMTYQKALNNIAKIERAYKMDHDKFITYVNRHEQNVKRSTDKIEQYNVALASCRITAPSDGIVIFGTTLLGEKLSRDQTVVAFDYYPPLATLPDMSEVISEIFVKEIDIAKIEKGDSVLATFDAIEGLALKGHIKEISKMGEDHKDFDMRVFKVTVYLDENDPRLKPAMSANIDIILEEATDVISIPLNTIYSENGETFVYLKNGNDIIKQPIKTGAVNEESILVEEGLSEGDIIVIDAENHLPELTNS
ncbi:MAG: efflux RND transporter periplasmic adaptor subunit [Prolixibacteraceae bacterium]|nr:efflux RND transporter periplasmic adaptor subunit [Prolixibacteraceae bacterium]